jgi:hypothetical protein
MSQRELLIVIAHANQCDMCRSRLLTELERVCSGRALTEEEVATLSKLTRDDFVTPDLLAKAAGLTTEALISYQDNPIVRLRHF